MDDSVAILEHSSMFEEVLVIMRKVAVEFILFFSIAAVELVHYACV